MSISQLLQPNSYNVYAKTINAEVINADSGIIDNEAGNLEKGVIRLLIEPEGSVRPSYLTNKTFYSVYGNVCFFQALILIDNEGTTGGNVYWDIPEDLPPVSPPVTDPEQRVNVIVNKSTFDSTFTMIWGEVTIFGQIFLYGFDFSGNKRPLTEVDIDSGTRITIYGHYFVNNNV